MKTAVCFSGYPVLGDYYLHLAQSLEYLVGPFESFWFIPVPFDYSEYIVPFKIQRIVIQEDEDLPNLEGFPENYNLKTGLEKFLQQIKGWQQVNELRKRHENESGIAYDRVVRCRPDIFFKDLQKIDFDASLITVPFFDSAYGFNDRFAVGPRELMDVYMNFFNGIFQNPSLVEDSNAEKALKRYLTAKEVSVQKDDRIKFNRIRMSSAGKCFLL